MNIHLTINKIMSDVGAIGKDKTNVQQGFKYRGVDDVMNALQPLFVKHKLYIVPQVLEHIREDRLTQKGTNLIYSVLKMQFEFIADDGSSVKAIVIGEGMDSGDKATNKAMAIAYKYACFQVFSIPTEEMPDPDAETHEVKGKVVFTKAATAAKPPNEITPNKPTPAQFATLIEFAKKKGVDLKVSGVTWTGKGSSKEWTNEDFEKVMNKLELLEDKK